MLSEKPLTAPEVADILSIGKNAVYALAKNGEIASYKIGRKLYFTPKAIDEYIAKLHVASDVHNTFEEDELTTDTDPGTLAANSDSFVFSGRGIAADMFIDRLEMMGIPATRRVRSSYASLVDLYKGRTDAAFSHLYDQRTNTYNVPYIQRIAPGFPVIVFRLLKRMQGFAVAPGNPKRITSWGALLREDIRLANRAKGCGSRVLLDEKLLSMEANPCMLQGYMSDYPTEFAAAEAVALKAADVAIVGEHIAAQIDGIEFVPLQTEWLDMTIAKTEKGRELARTLRRIFEDRKFCDEYKRIVYGNASNLGSIIYEC